MNLVQKATKVMGFKANIVRECKARNMRIPTDEKISEYINGGYGMKLEDFMYDYTHFEGVFRLPNREASPLETATLKATLEKLDDGQLHVLWNVFTQEIGNDGGEIYDLADDDESEYIMGILSQEELLEVGTLVTRDDARFIRIVDGKPQKVGDIRQNIEVYWSQIFDRVMMFPYCYNFDYEEGSGFFTNIIAPIMIEMMGYKIDYQTCEVEYKGEK